MSIEEVTPEEMDKLEGVIHQPTLPTLELPDYHGRKPVGMKTALAGAGTRVTRPHTIGDRVVLVIEAKVKAGGHEDTDDGIVWVEKLRVVDLFELDPAQGSRLISTVRSLYRTADDAVKGRRPLPDLGETGYTDASGVVLTPAEVAELRGDPVRAILSPELTPAVVVYDDGARDLWPDDYPKDAPRPKIGDKYLTENGDALVTELLHHETGEALEETFTPTDLAPFVEAIEQDLRDIAKASAPHLAAVPDLPPAADEDPYSGDLGDAADGWETAEPLRPLTAEEEETRRIEATLPTSADFAFVDVQISELLGKLAAVTDLDHARRIEKAERQGRGRGLKPRAGAMTAIGKRLAELEASMP